MTAHLSVLFSASALLLSAEVTSRDFYDAIRKNDLRRVQSYLDSGASVNLRDNRGATPLIYAARVGSVDAVRLLLKAGAGVNARTSLDSSALVYGVLDAAKAKLLLDAGAEVNVRTRLSRTPLQMAAGKPGSAEVVRMLLDKGADAAVADVRGNTALLEAARVDDIEVLRLLIGRKADIDAGDFAGITALGYAAAHSNLDAVRLLLENGAKVNASLKREIVVKNGVIAASFITPLMSAAPHGSTAVVKALLDAGADVKAKDVRGMTPLIYALAADTANPNVVRMLLDRGSEPSVKDISGNTALDWAKKFNQPEIVTMLGGRHAKPAAVLQPSGGAAADPGKAIERSLPLLESSSVEYFKQSGCVGCHHQDLIGGAVAAAARKALPVNAAVREEQLKIVKTEMSREREALLQSVFISVDSMAYVLSMFADQDYPADEITDAIVSLIASQQTIDGRWNEFPGVRPPLEASPVVTAALAVRGLSRYAIPARQAEFDARIASTRRWLAAVRPHAAYEQYFRLLGLKWSGAPHAAVNKAVAEVRRMQRSDGGFAQTVHLPSDAWATASALYALHEAGVPPQDAAYRRGAGYLLATQRPDGSWYVASRSPKFQPYFQSGFPHDHDQWISAAATAMAVKALAPLVQSPTMTATR